MILLIHSQTSTVQLEVWEWISNFIPHFVMVIIAYPCWDLSLFLLVKGVLDEVFFIPAVTQSLPSSQSGEEKSLLLHVSQQFFSYNWHFMLYACIKLVVIIGHKYAKLLHDYSSSWICKITDICNFMSWVKLQHISWCCKKWLHWYIEAWRIWPSFCRQHFQMHFIQRKLEFHWNLLWRV